VLRLGVDSDLPAQLLGEPLGQVDHLLERGNLVASVVTRVARAVQRDALLGAQRLELRQREVLGPPALDRQAAVDRLAALAVGELRMVGHIGRPRDLVLVTGDQHAVLGRDQVRLHVVGPHASAQLVGRQRVLGAVARGAAVRDHERL